MRWLWGRLFGRLGYGDWLLAAFAAGVLAGTWAALAGWQAGVLAPAAAGWSGIGRPGFSELWRIGRLRCGTVLLGWLAGMTVCGRALFGGFMFHGGFVMAAVLARLTLAKGFESLFWFGLGSAPQLLLYGFSWYVLARWAGTAEKRVRLPGLVLLLLLTGLGAVCEAFLH